MRLGIFHSTLCQLALLHSLCGICQNIDLFETSRNCTIYGTINDKQGKPIQGNIDLYKVNLVSDRGSLESACHVISTPEGGYACDGLDIGEYIAMVRPPQRVPSGAGSEHAPLTYGRAFYPGVTSVDAALPIVLTAHDKKVKADIIVAPVQSRRAFGYVIGRPKNVFFTLTIAGELFDVPSSTATTFNSENQSFLTDPLSPGRYILEAHWLADGKSQEATAEFQVGTEMLPPIVLQTQCVGQLRVGVHTTANGLEPGPDSIVVQSLTGTLDHRYEARIDGDGVAVIPDVHSGEYRIWLNGSEDFDVSTISSTAENDYSSRTTLKCGVGGWDIRLEADTNAARVNGTVDNTDTEAPHWISVQSMDDLSSKQFVSVKGGHFAFTSLKPGHYRISTFLTDGFHRAEHYMSVTLFAGEQLEITSEALMHAQNP